jgi:P27 family predicted phage terminase small subunit
MGRRGPPKKPTQLRILQGNPGKRSLNTDEPKPPRAQASEPPADLDAAAQEIWIENVPRLEALGLLSVLDLATFWRYCDLRSKFKKAKDFLDKNGFCYAIYHEQTEGEIAAHAKPRLKYMAQFPQVNIYSQLSKEITRLEQNFGMTPASRAGLNVIPPENQTGETTEDFLYGAGD